MNLLKKLSIAWVAVGAIVGAADVTAQDRMPAPSSSGFYGGVSMLDRGNANPGVDFSSVASAWLKYGSAVADDNGAHALVYGGYRFANDVAIEASLTRSDMMALPTTRPGMGLALASPADPQSRRWNADVYSSYNVGPAFALFGRVGYKQTESLPAYLLLASNGGVPARQGVNYGVGLRYDMTPTLGLKLEFARFGRFAAEAFSGAPAESDQVQIGFQYRF